MKNSRRQSGSHVFDACLTEEQGAGGVHRDPETTNQRAGGKGDMDKHDAISPWQRIHKRQHYLASPHHELLSLLLVFVSVPILLSGLHPLVLTAVGEFNSLIPNIKFQTFSGYTGEQSVFLPVGF